MVALEGLGLLHSLWLLLHPLGALQLLGLLLLLQPLFLRALPLLPPSLRPVRRVAPILRGIGRLNERAALNHALQERRGLRRAVGGGAGGGGLRGVVRTLVSSKASWLVLALAVATAALPHLALPPLMVMTALACCS